MKKPATSPTPPAQNAEHEALAHLPDEDINTTALPETQDWTAARRGLFYRPIKKQLTLRLDADLIDWFKSHTPEGEGYQTSINRALRDYITKRASPTGRTAS